MSTGNFRIPRKNIPSSNVTESDVSDGFRSQAAEAKRLMPHQSWVDDDDGNARYQASEQLPQNFGTRDEASKDSLIRRIGRSTWDLGGLIVSIAILVAIVIILRNYDGEVQPDWQFSFNLNSLVAILMTVLRTTMMDVVSDCQSFSRRCGTQLTEKSNESTEMELVLETTKA